MRRIQIKGIPLIKFKSEAIIDSLQAGTVWMNKVDLFRKMEQKEDDDGVADEMDSLLYIHEAVVVVPELGETQQVHDQGIKTKYSDDYGYFDYANILFGLVGDEGLKRVSFLKRNKYSFQQEYRFVLHKEGVTEDKVILEIGDIRDISEKIETKKLLDRYIERVGAD